MPALGKYYLGYFSAAQPDLNWQTPAMRAEIYDMMNWWLDRGIAGFLMDVISLIGKDVDAGIYEEGPHLHAFLQEMHRETILGRDVVTVGESWAVSRETALLYCGSDRRELDMVFQFQHILEGHDPVHGKWKPRPFDLVAFKRVLSDWQIALANDGWNSVFLSNHDLPRQVSKYGDDGAYRVASAKMRARVIHMMKGTPFVYQGEETGMTNMRFTAIDQFRDIEILGNYPDAMANAVTPEDFIAGANENGRDNARTPMQWSAHDQAGFTSGTPWIGVNPNHREINVEADRADPKGIFAYYRKLIALRKALPIVVHGRYRSFGDEDARVCAFLREHDGDRLAVVANFTDKPVTFDVPKGLSMTGNCLISNYGARTDVSGRLHLEPYEAFVVIQDRSQTCGG